MTWSVDWGTVLKIFFRGILALLLSVSLSVLPAYAQAEPVKVTPPAAPNSDIPVTNGSSVEWEQEFALWQAAAEGNTAVEYNACLDAYPEGKFHKIARSRIMRLQTEEAELTGGAEGIVDEEPQVILTSGVGTIETERLYLNREGRRELQGRLSSIGYNTRDVDGIFGRNSRSAIATWQSSNGAVVTGFLNLEQMTMIRQQSAEAYPRWRAAHRPKRHIVRRYDKKVNNPALFLGLAGAVIGAVALASPWR